MTSAGALLDSIRHLGAHRIAMIAPYAPELTARVIDYMADEADVDVVDFDQPERHRQPRSRAARSG